MKVACYIRVSTEMQVQEGYSLDAQREKLLNYCKSQDGWDVFDWYIDEGVSAKDLNRPDMQRMLGDAERGLFDVVLVYKLDRLTRSVRDLHKLLDVFEKANVKFRSATEVYDTTTAMGKLFITIVAALAEWERENLAERVRFGMEELVNQGKWHGGPVPYGYTWDKVTMHLVQEEYLVLRELRRLYMNGNGFGAVAKALNMSGKDRKGYPWSAQTVWSVLDNPFYAGKMRYGTKKKNGKYATRKKESLVNVIWADTGFPQVFTWEEYEEHKNRMKKREFYGSSTKREYWFAGVIRCARCGNTMIGRPYRRPNKEIKPGYINYICSGRSQQKGCNMPLLRQSVATDLIMQHIDGIKYDRARLEAAASAEEQVQADHSSEIDELRKELRTISERRKKWQYMFVEELLSEQDLRIRKREEDEKESVITERIEYLKSMQVGVVSSYAQLMYSLPDIWESLEDGEKKEIMQTIFESIVVECDVQNGKELSGKGKVLPFRILEVNFN